MIATILLWFNFLTFNESNYKVSNYTIRDGLVGNTVYTMVKDDNGRYWIATNGGLQMFDGYQFRTFNSHNGIKSKDILGLAYNRGHLYVFCINQMEIIPIKYINNSIGYNNLYNNNNIVVDNKGHVFTKKYTYIFYSNSYEKYHGTKLIESISIENPYYNKQYGEVRRLTNIPDNTLYAISRLAGVSQYLVSQNMHNKSYQIYEIQNGKLKSFINNIDKSAAYISYLKDSTFYIKYTDKRSTFFSNGHQSRFLFNDIAPNSIFESEKSVFFLATNYGIKQYNEKKFSVCKYSRWKFDLILNCMFSIDTLNLYNQFFMYEYTNNYLTELKTKKVLFPDVFLPSLNKNLNIKSHYVLNDSLILLGYRKGINTILYNYKTRKIKKEYDPVWVKKVRAEDENNLFILTYDDFRIYKNGVKKVYQLKHKGSYILTNDLLRSGSRYIYGTNDQGVFISDTNFKFQKHYHHGNGLQSNLIHQLKESDDGQLWLRSEKGIDRILKNGKVERIFAFNEIEDYDIKDFTASQDSLWVFTEKHVYALEYKTRLNPRKISLVWHNLTVNDTQNFYPIDSNITIGPSWEKLKIEYAGIHLEDQSNIRYRYRIVHNGDTANWIETDQISFVSSSITPGHYVFQLQAYHQIYPNTCSEIKNIVFYIKPYFYQTWWFYGLVFFGSILAALSILYYRNKLKMRTLRAEAELHKTTLHGLQTQMNPHFVFNAMNTLQHFILEKDLDSSLKYLNEFSSLIRTILENSSQFEIFLKDEIQFLKKYIDVESKRFENQFTSEILVHIDDTDLQDIKIPPMLIQPLVENAIKHGMPTAPEGKAAIRIEFSMNSDTKLDIKIIDNGSREIINDNSKSKAINILQERIALIEKRGEKASFQLYREQNETIAHLILPI